MAERTRYIVRRMPTAYELHEAQERAATRRVVRDGVITALLVLGTVAAILAAGPMPARPTGAGALHPCHVAIGARGTGVRCG